MEYVSELITEATRLTQGKATLIMLIIATLMLVFFDRAPPVLRGFAYAVITFSVVWFGWITLKIHWYGVPEEEKAAIVEQAPAKAEDESPFGWLRRTLGLGAPPAEKKTKD